MAIPTIPPYAGNWMQWRNTYFNDVHGSLDGNFYFDRGMVTRIIHVAGGAVDQAITDFMGSVTVENAGVSGGKQHRYISRTLPHNLPNKTHLYVQGIPTIKRTVFDIDFNIANDIGLPAEGATVTNVTGGFFDGTALPIYKIAEMTLQYVMPTFKIKSDNAIVSDDTTLGNPYLGFPDEGYAISRGYRTYSRYISRYIKRSGRMQTIPRGLLRDNTAEKRPILEAVAINENVATFEYIWHQVPDDALPELTWVQAQNSVNQYDFDGRPAGTLLFSGDPEVTPEPNPITGQMLNSVKYTFHSFLLLDKDETPEAVRGHNYIRRLVAVGDPAVYKLKVVKMTSDGLGVLPGTVIFPDFDFQKLFRPDPINP